MKGTRMMDEVPPEWEAAAAALIAQCPPPTERDRRELTKIAVDFARKRASDRQAAAA